MGTPSLPPFPQGCLGEVKGQGLYSYPFTFCYFMVLLGLERIQQQRWTSGSGAVRVGDPFDSGRRLTLSLMQVRTNVPSWCDRILWKSYPETHIICNSYGQSLLDRVLGPWAGGGWGVWGWSMCVTIPVPPLPWNMRMGHGECDPLSPRSRLSPS